MEVTPVLGMSEEDELIPIRMVESVVYCPRQAWYRFVANDDRTNSHMVRGLARHEQFGEAEPRTKSGVTFRHLAVRAPLLGVAGVLDEVTIGTELTITEYKTARLAPLVWPGVSAQLAVQYLALREHASRSDWHGPTLPASVVLRVYLTESRRYRSVPWGPSLEGVARTALAEARRIVSSNQPSDGLVGPRCSACQHEPICLPFDLPKLVEACR